MDILIGERVLMRSPDGRIVLTTHRVIYSLEEAGSARVEAVMLLHPITNEEEKRAVPPGGEGLSAVNGSS